MRHTPPLLAICALVLGCKVRKREPPSAESVSSGSAGAPLAASSLTPAQIAELRAEMIAGATLFGRPELTPTDPVVTDRCVIDSLTDGRYPATPKEREDYLWYARTCLTSWLSYKPGGLDYLTRRIAERYARPVITRDGDAVRIDAGVVAGTPGVYRSRLQIMKSPNLERGELISSEVVQLLALGTAAHPDARTYELQVDIPASGSKGVWKYRFDRAEDQIRMYSADRPALYYVTSKLGGHPEKAAWGHHTDLTKVE